MVAPAGTPKATIERLNSAVRTTLKPTDMKDKLASIGVEAVDQPPAQFGALITADIAKWEKIVKPLKITPE